MKMLAMISIWLSIICLLGITISVQGSSAECRLNDGYNFGKRHFNECINDENSRESRFINLRQYRDSVQMEVDFALPFMSIPVNKSLSGIMPGSFNGLGQLQLNFPSLLMTGVIALGGAFLGGFNKMFSNRWNQTILLEKLMSHTAFHKTRDFPALDLKKFGEEFIKYRQRRSERRREPRFINLRQYANAVQIELDFVIPFLSIPVNKSVRSFMDMMQQPPSSGFPLPIRQGGFLGEFQINYPAFAMGLFVIVAGVLVGAFNRISKNGLFFNSTHGNKSTNKQSRTESQIWIMNLIDKALQKYKLDSRICSQKAVCWYVRESKIKVQKNQANKLEKFVDGLTSANWALEMIGNTAIEKGVIAGKNYQNCNNLFDDCRLTENSFENFFNIFI